MNVIERYPENVNGRDFVCGDIHGCFREVEKALEKVDFDTRCDRLFCTGDLIDRGPSSEEAVWWWSQPWFHAVVGNHEIFLHDSVDIYGFVPGAETCWYQNGGGWWNDLPQEQRREFYTAVDNLPYLIEVFTKTMRVGIVHAQIPVGHDFDSAIELIEENHIALINDMVWSRGRVNSGIEELVEDVDYIFCGHTIQKTPKLLGNHWFIDTGAFVKYWGREGYGLTLIELE